MSKNNRCFTSSRSCRSAIAAAVAALFLVAVACVAPMRAQDLFAELGKTHLPPDAGGQACAIGDVDGDGDLDLVLGYGQSRLYLNDGAGRFADATVNHMPARNDCAVALALGDVDGDGDLEDRKGVVEGK